MGRINFSPSYDEILVGELRQGGYLQISYAPERLPDCRNSDGGHAYWDIIAHGRFLPSGEAFDGSVVRILNSDGSLTAQPEILTVRIPQDEIGIQQVEIWFENFNRYGPSCHAWDSNYGANYKFDIALSADHPRCRDIEKDNLAIHGEDERMPHNEPYCLNYWVSENHHANFCEFWPQDLGLGYIGHYGFPFHWLFVNLTVGPNDGQVLAAGLFVRYHDNKTAKDGVRFALGNEVSPGLWRAGFVYYVDHPYLQVDLSIIDFAFFIDVRRASGHVVRLWQSRSGQNFSLQHIYSHPTYSESIPYGNIQWADQASAIFDSKRSCAHN